MNKGNLRQIRRKIGLTQAQLAKQMRVDQASISRWEAGSVTIPGTHWSNLVALLDKRNEGLHPIVTRLMRRNKNISVVTKDRRCSRMSRALAKAFQVDLVECNASLVHQFFSPVLHQLDIHSMLVDETTQGTETLFAEIDADLSMKNGMIQPSVLRVNSRCHRVKLDDLPEILLIASTIIGMGTGQRPEIKMMFPGYNTVKRSGCAISRQHTFAKKFERLAEVVPEQSQPNFARTIHTQRNKSQHSEGIS